MTESELEDLIEKLETRIYELEWALHFTQEYVGDETLPKEPSWTWWAVLGCFICNQPSMRWRSTERRIECATCGAIRLTT